ncbi:hypothetical protein [Nonomuraea terrae]|uniref:hypothetical protein n=1 Tax=Nonomuraea terrae TaxID=2530383 RepID=UPI001652155A|nr:hypothetical protein [Nonomuraea terrae]
MRTRRTAGEPLAAAPVKGSAARSPRMLLDESTQGLNAAEIVLAALFFLFVADFR